MCTCVHNLHPVLDPDSVYFLKHFLKDALSGSAQVHAYFWKGSWKTNKYTVFSCEQNQRHLEESGIATAVALWMGFMSGYGRL